MSDFFYFIFENYKQVILQIIKKKWTGEHKKAVYGYGPARYENTNVYQRITYMFFTCCKY